MTKLWMAERGEIQPVTAGALSRAQVLSAVVIDESRGVGCV
jgi:hypothetical protein